MELRKEELNMGKPFRGETMAVHRVESKAGIDWVVTSVWLGVLAFIGLELWAICAGHTCKLVAIWCAMGAVYCWVDMARRGAWAGLAEFMVGICAMVAGAALWGGVA